MALPTLDFSKYELKIPSTGETLVYRAFLVKEQKIILQAIEMGDTAQLNHAVEDVVRACTFNKFDLDAAPLYDVEWVLLNIRAKSAGEIVEMIYRCNHLVDSKVEGEPQEVCGGKIIVNIPLTAAEVIKPENHNYKIMLTDDVGITMQDLRYGVYKAASGKKATEAGEELIHSCIANVFDSENVFGKKDFTHDELEAFLGQFDTARFAKVEDFIETMPFLELSLPIRCPECGAKDQIVLRGLDDFLA